MRQIVWNLWYADIAVEGSELYCHKTEGNKNSDVSQVSCIMDVNRPESVPTADSGRFGSLQMEYEYSICLKLLVGTCHNL